MLRIKLIPCLKEQRNRMPEINIYDKKMLVLERDYTKIFKNSKDFQNSKPAGVTFVGKKDTGLQ